MKFKFVKKVIFMAICAVIALMGFVLNGTYEVHNEDLNNEDLF